MKISLICNSSQQSGFRIPSLDAVLKLVEEKYIKTYRITEPGFSVVKLMKDVCECFLAEGTNCTDDGQVRSTNLTSSLTISKKLNPEKIGPKKFGKFLWTLEFLSREILDLSPEKF